MLFLNRFLIYILRLLAFLYCKAISTFIFLIISCSLKLQFYHRFLWKILRLKKTLKKLTLFCIRLKSPFHNINWFLMEILSPYNNNNNSNNNNNNNNNNKNKHFNKVAVRIVQIRAIFNFSAPISLNLQVPSGVLSES